MSELLQTLELAPFRQRFPWLGPDLQTLRDTLRPLPSPRQPFATREFQLPSGDRLLARIDLPTSGSPRGLIVVVHGLGGCSDDGGQRRLAQVLVAEGFGVIRLNLRGAGPGRPLAGGSYAAACTTDVRPVLRDCRRLAAELAGPGQAAFLGAAGISLGGTVLLNVLLDSLEESPPPLDALVTISSPLELSNCSEQFDRPRNRLYQRWMVRRLIRQTLLDPQPLSAREREGLTGSERPRTIREFDALITAPRWGFEDVDAYYRACSPFSRLRQCGVHAASGTPAGGPHAGGTPAVRPAVSPSAGSLPRLLLLHAKDDPWVPAEAILRLEDGGVPERVKGSGSMAGPQVEVVITTHGGHCGFHSPEDSRQDRWSDRLTARWLSRTLREGHGPRTQGDGVHGLGGWPGN